MSNRWFDKYDIKFTTAVKDVSFNGISLGLTETEAGILTSLLHGPVPASSMGGLGSAAVRISHIRAKLAKAGLPIIIRNTNGNIGRPGCLDPKVRGGSYYLVERGVVYASVDASNSNANRLQSDSGGTRR